MTFEDFVAQCEAERPFTARAHVHEVGITLYVRKPPRGLRPIGVDFDLANMVAHPRGKGALTRFLDRYERLYGFYVENILEPRLVSFFERRGYRWYRRYEEELSACMYRRAGGPMVSGLQHEEPTAYEWKVVKDYIEELAKLGVMLDGQKRFIVRNAAIEMLIKHRKHLQGEGDAPPT